MIETNLKKGDLKEILKEYSIGVYINHMPLKYIGNNTIIVIITSLGRYIIKISEKYNLEYLLFVLSVQDFVSKNNYPVPHIEHTKRGELFLTINKRIIIIQEFIEGKHPEKYTEALLKNMASTNARLNKTLLEFPPQEKKVWDWKWRDDYLLDIELYTYVIRWNIEKKAKLISDISDISKFKLRKSIIHGDLTDVNLLVDKNRIAAIIDWDNCREDYITQDIAVALTCVCENNREIDLEKIALYIHEYENDFELSYEERKSIYYFMKMNMLANISWYSKQLKKHTKSRSSMNECTIENIKLYKALDKLSLEKFMDLF